MSSDTDSVPLMDLGGILAAGGSALIVGLIIYAVVTIAVMLFGIWLTYTIIWRAVRRGLREFHGHAGNTNPALYPPQWTSPARHIEPQQQRPPTLPLRPDSGPRDW